MSPGHFYDDETDDENPNHGDYGSEPGPDPEQDFDDPDPREEQEEEDEEEIEEPEEKEPEKEDEEKKLAEPEEDVRLGVKDIEEENVMYYGIQVKLV
ncbi:hypothetical protein Q3G72_023806 [Acer saccharum]|nr:hypothetical protein Q3G72_023806 [Acer saccharum]